MVFSHIKESDKRWSETIVKQTDELSHNTKALEKLVDRHETMGDRLAIILEKALHHNEKQN